MKTIRELTAIGTVSTLLLLATSAFGATVTLRWNANGESDLAGYTVLYGLNTGVYTGSVNVGNTTQVGIPGLNAGTRYYFSLKAYDTSGNVSPAASEVSVVTAASGPPDTTAPTVTGVSTAAAGVVSVTFSETVDAATAEDPSNYLIDDGQVAVLSATLESDGRTVRLTTDLQAADAFHTITVTGVADLAATPNLSNLQVAYQVDLSLQVTVVSPTSYDVLDVTPGDAYYVDQTLPIDAIPMPFRGATWVRTADADNINTNAQWLTFHADHDVIVYVGYDRRATPPTWLTDGFVPVGDGPSSDNSGTPFAMWARDYPAGDITLGGNAAPGSSGVQRNYVVLVKPLPATGTAADADADGMDDGWEADNGLDPTRLDAHEDPDGDGLTNLEEFWLGTDPQVANAVAGGANQPPVLSLDESVVGIAGQPISMDASGASDPDGDPLAWSWHQVLGPNVTLSGSAQATATFTPSDTGLYAFTVTVRDGNGGAVAKTVYVEVFEDILTSTTTALGANLLVDTGPLAGTLLSIPSGAMDKAYPVAVGSGGMPASLPSGYAAVSDVLIFAPSEIQLLAPATIRLPYLIPQASRGKAGDPLDLLQYDMTSGTWTSVPIGRDLGNVVEANVDTLGTFVVTTKPVGGGIGASATDAAAGGGGCAAGTTGGPADALPFLLALLWAVGRAVRKERMSGKGVFRMPIAWIAVVAGLLLLPHPAMADSIPPAAPSGVTVTDTTLDNVPTISGTPTPTAPMNAPYSFEPTGQDLDGQTLAYSIVNRPFWASFNTVTGALTGTPGSSNVGTTSGIVISVTAGGATASLPAFDLTVLPVTGGTSPVLFTDLTYCPKVAGQDCFVTLVGLDLPNPATVLVAGKPQTVLAQGVLDGNGWRPLLQKHEGLVQDGLTDSATGYYDYIEVRLTNVVAGDSGISLSGVAGTTPFTVGSSGSIYFADPDSGNDSNAGTIGAPWLHIQPIQNKTCGSILYLRGSTTEYARGGNSFGFFQPTSSCTASAPRAVVGYPGEHAILNTNGTRAYYSSSETNYQDMAKLEVNGHGTGTQALYPPGDGHHFTLMTFHDIHSGNTGSVFELKGCSSHFWYQGNYAYNTGQNNNQSHASYFGGYEGSKCGYTSGDLHANYNEYSGHDGGYILGAYSHLSNDHITDLEMSWNYFHDKTANQPGHQILVVGNGDGKRDWIDHASVRGNTMDLGGINNVAVYFANDATVAQVHNNVVYGSTGGKEWEFGNINGGNTWPAVAPGSSATGNCGDRAFSIGSLTAPNLFTSNNGSDYPACLVTP